MNQGFKKNLNDLIKYNSSGFGPALNNLLLYGPIEKNLILDDNYDLLKNREKVISIAYKESIIPKLSLILNTLTPDEVYISNNKKKLNQILKIRTLEFVREKIKNNYKNQFELSLGTLNALNSNKKLQQNKYIKFALINNYLISYRKKDPKNISNKFKNIYQIIEKNNLKKNISREKFRNRFNSFLELVINSSFKYWDEYSYYSKVYKDLNEFMIGDDFGLKIIDLKQERAEKRMEELIKINGDLKIPGFRVIKERFDNHIGRLDSKRPGGIHYTLTDIGLNNFPIEVQYQGIKSFIYDHFGPNSHNLYSLRNKKLNYN